MKKIIAVAVLMGMAGFACAAEVKGEMRAASSAGSQAEWILTGSQGGLPTDLPLKYTIGTMSADSSVSGEINGIAFKAVFNKEAKRIVFTSGNDTVTVRQRGKIATVNGISFKITGNARTSQLALSSSEGVIKLRLDYPSKKATLKGVFTPANIKMASYLVVLDQIADL